MPDEWYAANLLSEATDKLLPVDPYFGPNALTPATTANMRDQILDLAGCLDARGAHIKETIREIPT